MFSLETAIFVLTPPTSSALSPVDTSAIIGAAGCAVGIAAFFTRGAIVDATDDCVGITAFLTRGVIAFAGVVVVVVVVTTGINDWDALGAMVATEA